ncbi:MFS transporter [Mycobacterium hubeiense]|uniref:MFS transporter n=1 Tax=Mycobacterium hubeiense TaxID=1867256 RepID=UPI000C7F1F1E|nr:MFS transporter [Mycobacterium sp. QGD 101]
MAGVLYAYLFLDDFVLLYPVYTLLFSDTGLSVWQISSLLVTWSVSSLAFEVPSGAWADATSRRRLLIGGPLLTAVAFALWVGSPGYCMFALGFLLWGLKGALTSGALEALVYDELAVLGATDRYATLMGRGNVAGVLAAMFAGAAAAPALVAGGFVAVGAASVAVSVLAAGVAMLFPENKIGHAEPGLSWADAVSAGVAEARRSRTVLAAVVLVAVIASVWGALDEYTPLLIDSTGVSAAEVALLMVVVWAGAAAGGLLAGPAGRLGDSGLSLLVVCGAVLMSVGALAGHPAGVVALAVAFGVFQLATVVADARLQHSISGSARATVTSLAGMTTDVATLMVCGSYAALADAGGHSGAFAVLTLPYLAVAAWLVYRQDRSGTPPVCP